MKGTRLVVLVAATVLAAGTLLSGTAHAFSTSGSLSVNHGDTYTISCTNASTHCIQLEVCDTLATPDIFQQVLAVTSPTSLIGKTQNETAIDGGCTGTQVICRSGTGVGPMKGLAMVTHPSGSSGDFYDIFIECLDKNFNVLPDVKLKVLQTENNN